MIMKSISELELYHYSSEPVLKIENRSQLVIDRPVFYLKPKGIWVSVEGGDPCWREWCVAEGFRIDSFKFQQKITLVENPNIKFVSTPQQLHDFHHEYRSSSDQEFLRDSCVDWVKVASNFGGIIIAPYIWSERLGDISWYYTWDCASGCIWDASQIKEVTSKPYILNQTSVDMDTIDS